jgi:GTPase SAR1 family protein
MQNYENQILSDVTEKLSINPRKKLTVNLIILGMAGSGKTTFVKKLEEYLVEKEKDAYIINMDPAVHDTLYEPNLDIRDTVKYKDVMVGHGLGPNGAIMTCLNLFSTNIHKIIDVLENKDELDYICIDTPGQLEVFSWSASGKLISDSFSLIYPTVKYKYKIKKFFFQI